jgi:hypothetical protein
MGGLYMNGSTTAQAGQTGASAPGKVPLFEETWGAVLDADFPDSYIITRDNDELWKKYKPSS